jgi:pimeloyl-ACP methyl ester carboxylesterase
MYKISLRKGQVNVHTYGRGPKLMIAWHGYGYDGSVYASWEETLGEQYTICAPDLPFHGQTTWSEREFKPEDVQEILTKILAKQATTNYSLAGHSLGARLLVCNALEWANQCEQFVLLAPAGIGSFDRVFPLWVQRIAEAALFWPDGLRFFVNLGHRLGWVSNFHRRYAEVQLYPPNTRNRLFRVYNSLRHLRTTRADRKAFWESTPIATLVVLAEQDRFVPNHAIRKYFSVNESTEIEVVRGNHELVNAETARVLRERL